MPVQLRCEQCSQQYWVEPRRASKSRFCSAACLNASNRTAARKTLTCEACGSDFQAKMDHGIWPKYCSRKCFLAGCLRPTEKECAACGALFVAGSTSHETEDGYRRYCSNKCRIAGLVQGDEHECVQCGSTFRLSPSTLQARGEARCCSEACQRAYYHGARHSAFKGGVTWHPQGGYKQMLLPRPGYVGRYIGEHRLVASRAIGRLLTRQEFVLRINNDEMDNRPENLFICESNSEAGKRRHGSLPWPTESNLNTYAAHTRARHK